MTENVQQQNLDEKWAPLIAYYKSNGVKKEDIDELVKRLDANKDKFVKKSYYDKGIYNGIIAQWKRDRKIFTSYAAKER